MAEPVATGRSTNYFSVFAWIVLIATVLAAGGLFAYQKILTGQINKANAEIVSARDSFQPDTIKELVDVAGQIMSVQGLLNSHVAVSRLLETLQSLILKNAQFNNFQFSIPAGVPSISMDVEAKSYNALAEQYNIFSQNTVIQDPSFLNYTLLDNGDVSTKFTGTIDPILISYKDSIESSASAAATTTNQ